MPTQHWLKHSWQKLRRQRRDRPPRSVAHLFVTVALLGLSALLVVSCSSQLRSGRMHAGAVYAAVEGHLRGDRPTAMAHAAGALKEGDRPALPNIAAFTVASSDAITSAAPGELPLIRALEPALPFSGDVQQLSPDLRRIIERGYLRVALPQNDSFPFFYTTATPQRAPATLDELTDMQGLAGLDIQIARSLAAYLGVAVTFERDNPSFDAVVNRVFRQEADLAIAKLSLTLNRARKIHYSQPYVRLRPGLLFNRLALSRIIDFDLQRNPVDAVRQMGNAAELGVIQASSYASFVRGAFPDATIREYPDWESVIDAVIHGRVLAGCRDELAIKHEILTRPNANVQMQSVVMAGWTDKIAIVLPWESESLREFVNHYLAQTDLTFTADQLLTQFVDVSVDVDSSLLLSP